VLAFTGAHTAHYKPAIGRPTGTHRFSGAAGGGILGGHLPDLVSPVFISGRKTTSANNSDFDILSLGCPGNPGGCFQSESSLQGYRNILKHY
jgi:hypothetical protein